MQTYAVTIRLALPSHAARAEAPHLTDASKKNAIGNRARRDIGVVQHPARHRAQRKDGARATDRQRQLRVERRLHEARVAARPRELRVHFQQAAFRWDDVRVARVEA